jgi:flagellin-like hook-associated protein FlgL
MANVTISAAVRGSLIALQGTAQLIEQTQGRLASGLKVASPVDDPVAFFQAKTLSDRANDLTQKKNNISQGISTVTAALDAVKGVENIVAQLKGLVNSAKSATTSTQISTLITQFNDLRSQIDLLTGDAQYQGINLINGTGTTLQVSFSTDTASLLNVNSVDVRSRPTGLNLNRAVATASNTSGINFSFVGSTAVTLGTAGVTVTYAAAANLTFGSAGAYDFSYGTTTLTLSVGSAGATTTTFATNNVLSAGVSFAFGIQSATTSVTSGNLTISVALAGTPVTIGNVTGQNVFAVNFTTEFNNLITNLDAGLAELRAEAQKFGTNVALLQTRLDFTTSYVSTLQTGADKLTLADLNEEGANLLALQTRQQLGISALAFAGQSEQQILALFQ